LKKERSVAFDTGYQEGNLNGYTNGNDEGYKQGYKDGCYYVFTKIGPNLIAIESPFYASDIYGYYWTRSEVCK
jgi:flagellar biosynthesis/type III secretory pathway protein FliH